MSDQGKPPRPWRMFLPLAGLLLLGLVWSGIWFAAARGAERMIDALLQREAARGHMVSCDDRALSGYPFRIILDCRNPRLLIDRRGERLTYQAQHLKAVAQVWRFNHIIAEVTGPVAVAPADRPDAPLFIGQWTLAQASAVLQSDAARALDISIDGLAIALPRKEPASADLQNPLLTAAHVEAHALRREEVADRLDYDLALSGNSIVFGARDNVAPQALIPVRQMEMRATVRGLPRGISDDPRRNLQLWQANQGTLTIDRLWVDADAGAALANGNLLLEPSGKPSGALTLAIANADALVQNGDAEFLRLIMSGLKFIGRKRELDGRQAIEVDLTLRDGAVALGPAIVGQIPPLF